MYDPQVFEGLLGGRASSGIRGGVYTTDMAWRECDGVFYELDRNAADLHVFVSSSGWYGGIGSPELF